MEYTNHHNTIETIVPDHQDMGEHINDVAAWAKVTEVDVSVIYMTFDRVYWLVFPTKARLLFILRWIGNDRD